MEQILPSELAKLVSLELISRLDNSKLGKKLKEKNNGRMIGVLFCTNGKILYAYSGSYSEDFYSFNPNFVQPCFNVDEFNETLKLYGSVKYNNNIDEKKSRECFKKIQELYKFYCYNGSIKKLNDIYSSAPAGTGDCCAPRLLSYCYSKKMEPLSMCEFFYGDGSLKHKEYYTPCNSKCKKLLEHIIGLDILYYDHDIVVINKPSGLLSVPGINEKDSVQTRVKALFKNSIIQPSIHRLDMDTSGIIILGLTEIGHNRLSKQFQERTVTKEYTALINGVIKEKEGIIDLPIRKSDERNVNYIIDSNNGKKSITLWKLIRIEKINNNDKYHLVSRIKFMPITGRTHQIRVHCAYGLNMPIINDKLYQNTNNTNAGNESNMIKNINNGNLTLCANRISFTHPVSNKKMEITVKEEF